MSDLTRIEARLQQAREATEALRPVFLRVAELRKAVNAAGEPSEELSRRLTEAEAEAQRANDEHRQLVNDIIRESGIPEEVWDALAHSKIKTDDIDRTPRATVAASEVATTGMLEALTPHGLEFLRARVSASWLETERKKGHHLQAEFLAEPLVLVRGMRIASERRSIHRLAQMMLVSDDYLSGSPGYDRFAGALLVPQVASLGQRAAGLANVMGEVEHRISALWRLPSETVDSTIYELVVAAACAERGRLVEFLATSSTKTPDLRVHDFVIPVTIECKRRARVTDRDIKEDRWASEIYSALRPSLVSRGMTGTVAVHLSAPVEQVTPSDVVDAAIRLRLSTDPRRPTRYPWGSIAFHRVPRRVFFPASPLYGPRYLHSVFGWDTDLPTSDGIVCQAQPQRSLIVQEAREPLALTWIQENQALLSRRARAPAALLGEAMRQVPIGEVGLIYVCYEEADRETIADERMKLLQRVLRDWTYEYDIRVPAVLVTRLLPRAIGEGGPDLIETGLQFYSKTMGDPSWFDDFPSRVFTNLTGEAS